MGNDFSKKISSLTQNNNKINVSSNIFGINSDALATHYSDRYNFYIQWLASIKSDNPDVFNKLMEIYSLYVQQNKKIEDAKARLINDIGGTDVQLNDLKKKLQTTVYKDLADKINVGNKGNVATGTTKKPAEKEIAGAGANGAVGSVTGAAGAGENGVAGVGANGAVGSVTGAAGAGANGAVGSVTGAVGAGANGAAGVAGAGADQPKSIGKSSVSSGGGQSTINSTEGNYIFQKGGADVTQIVKKLHTVANNYPKKDDTTKKQIMDNYNNIEGTDSKIKLAELIYKDPLLNPENENVRLVDRAIFIALTYIIRVISLFITEWAIFTGFISSFAGAFNMYFITYICIFVLIVLITNSSSKNIVFKVLLYYINTSTTDGKGMRRILFHVGCILLLLPIPYIVKDYSIADKNKIGLSYAERANIISGVDKFSLYAWIITSCIAFYL